MPDLQEHLLLDPFAIPEAWRDQLAAPAYIAGEASLFEHPNFDCTRFYATSTDIQLTQCCST